MAGIANGLELSLEALNERGLSMDAAEIGGALGLSAMVAAAVAIVKGLWPGEMPARAVVATVALVTGALVAAGVAGGEITGTPLQVVGQWLLQAATAIGFREALVTAIPKAGDLPSRAP